MNNFSFYNPVEIVFGKGTISSLPKQLGKHAANAQRLLLLYGGGSIKKNGVYEQVLAALQDSSVEIVEFGGIEANPQYETCLKAVRVIEEHNCDFILSVGGGSVLDAAKFIAAAARTQTDDPWSIVTGETRVSDALPIACVMTLPATASEMNTNSVISRAEICDKRGWASPKVFPLFSILDPETTYSLPARQSANGIVDSFVHVMEQYLTYPVNSPLQDRFAEGILLTLIEEGPKVMADPQDYQARANIFWAATMALNRIIGVGVVQDWVSHAIGHEITAAYGIDHGRTLAIVLPGVMKYKQDKKREKLLQYAQRVWGITSGDDQSKIDQAIAKTEAFFESLGVPTRLKGYELSESEVPTRIAGQIGKKIAAANGGKTDLPGTGYGEHRDIGPAEVEAILQLRA